MHGMQIENRACIILLRPGQKTLIIALDQADGSINEVHFVLSEIFPDLVKEISQLMSGDIRA